MAYIEPNSDIQIFGDVSLAPTQEDTLYFSSTSAKDTYFSGVTRLATLSSQSYTRKSRNYIRVNLPISSLYNACYMRFKNTSFENKWFYAFVTEVEYINNITTEVRFEIDTMMSWMGDFSLAQCFVERQHSGTDGIGDNIVEENLELGDYVNNAINRSNLWNSYTMVLGCTVDEQGDDITGEMVNGLYSGVHLQQFGTASALNNFIDELTDKAKSDAIVACTMCPGNLTIDSQGVFNVVSITKSYNSLNGYQPNNNKLFTYPYNYLQVTNGQGNYATFRWEFFNQTTTAQFNVGGVASLNPEIVLMPKQYKGTPSTLNDISEKMTLSGFPMCSFNVDAYKAYIAQNKTSLQTEVISTGASGIISTIMSGVSGNIGGAVSSAVSTVSRIAEINANLVDYARKPPQSGGSQGSDTQVSYKLKDFYFYSKSITNQYARIIDNFFTMFGYAQKRVMTPNMNARPYFTYVKTVDCVVHGNIPADDCRKIEEMFNRGVRFWKNHSNIGNYSLNNSPT